MSEQSQVRRPRKTGLRVGAVVAVLVVVGALIVRARQTPPAAEAPVEASPPPGTFRATPAQLKDLTIVPVAAVSFQGDQFTDGAIAANDDTSTPVLSPLSGRVTAVYAKLGDVVAKGAPLMSVEASEFVQGQNDLVSAVGAVATAQAQVTLTAAAEQRQRELLLAKAGALKDLLQSQSDAAAAQSALRSGQIALDAARNRLVILGKTPAEIHQLETSPATSRMSPNATVRSPIAGTIIQRQVGLGQYIQSGATGGANAVFTVADLSTVWLDANVRENDSAGLKPGQAVQVQVPAWPGRVFNARLTWVAAALDPNTHRLLVRAEIANRDGALKPMMFANFRITTGSAVSAPGIPQEAVVYEGSDAHVFVASDDGVLRVRAVHTGRVSGDTVEVTDGLKVGEKVVTRGALFIDRATESK